VQAQTDRSCMSVISREYSRSIPSLETRYPLPRSVFIGASNASVATGECDRPGITNDAPPGVCDKAHKTLAGAVSVRNFCARFQRKKA